MQFWLSKNGGIFMDGQIPLDERTTHDPTTTTAQPSNPVEALGGQAQKTGQEVVHKVQRVGEEIVEKAQQLGEQGKEIASE